MTYSIVVIEDSQDDIFLIREALTGAGFEFSLHVIEESEQVTAALSGAMKPQPDFWLVDLNLPKADGFAIIQMVRANANHATTPVLAISSSDSQRDREQAHKAGATAYFCKPLDLDEFMKLGGLVSSLLDAKSPVDPESREPE